MSKRAANKAAEAGQCECADRGCKEHKGQSSCLAAGDTILFRVDMADETGTLFCEACATDAMESGLFTESK